MTEQVREQVSAFIDDELGEAEAALLLRRLTTSDEAHGAAKQWLTLGQRLRAEHRAADDGFADRVSQALANEPALQSTAASAVSVAPWWRALAGSGIAAVVALAVINYFPAGQTDSPADAGVVANSEESASRVDGATNVDYVVPATMSDSAPVQADAELAAYFLSHSRSVPSLAPGSGRARIVANPTDYGDERDDTPPDDAADADPQAAR